MIIIFKFSILRRTGPTVCWHAEDGNEIPQVLLSFTHKAAASQLISDHYILIFSDIFCLFASAIEALLV